MPLVNDNSMQDYSLQGSHYGFSAKRIDDLGASEYTLGLIVVDVSGSVASYDKEIEKTVKEIVRACRHSPRADNLMLRLVTFDNNVQEIHGYKPLIDCHDADYDAAIVIGGTTALYDAIYNGMASVVQYAKSLTDQDFDVNAAVFVITDGQDNASTATRKMVKDAFAQALTSEALESLVSVLIGVNDESSGLNTYLRELQVEGGFGQYVSLGEASASQLSNLGNFVSQSISMQSVALGTGQAGQSLTF